MPESPLILVVDDEPNIARLASAVLTRAGFRTLTATSAPEALKLWTPGVKALLTDCIMPDLLGHQLAEELLRRDPSLRVFFMSGNSIEALDGSRLEPGVNFLQKPFTREELLQLMKKVV